MTDPVPHAAPVLPVADLVRAIAFYERLGFTVSRAFDQYAILDYQGTEVHLSEVPEVADLDTWTGAYLRVPDVDVVHEHWTAMGARQLRPPTDEPYGMREFATEDPDGNLWRVSTPVGGDVPPPPEPEPEVTEVTEAMVVVELEADPDDDRWFPMVRDGRTCAQCGLVNGELHPRAIGAEVRDLAHAFGERLRSAPDDAVRARPSATTWSALEYGVHVRDVLTVFAERIVLTKAQHEPELGWWDHEAAIADGMANESDVDAVADDLGRNASKLSEALRLVTEDDWSRGATRREGERFTIELMARFVLHEVVHHRWDAASALGDLDGR